MPESYRSPTHTWQLLTTIIGPKCLDEANAQKDGKPAPKKAGRKPLTTEPTNKRKVRHWYSRVELGLRLVYFGLTCVWCSEGRGKKKKRAAPGLISELRACQSLSSRSFVFVLCFDPFPDKVLGKMWGEQLNVGGRGTVRSCRKRSDCEGTGLIIRSKGCSTNGNQSTGILLHSLVKSPWCVNHRRTTPHNTQQTTGRWDMSK